MGQESQDFSVWKFYSDTVQGIAQDLWNRDSPITQWLVLTICLVFLVQMIAAVVLQSPILGITSYFFLEHPVPAWLLSFFLHKGVLHFLANIALIGITGRVVEQYFSTRAYLQFIAVAAVFSGIGAFLFRAPFTPKPVAAYGASGFGFALATYSFYLPFKGDLSALKSLDPENMSSNTTPAERFIFLLGVSAIIKITYNLATGPYFTVEWTNGAHLIGGLVGLVIGWIYPPTMFEREKRIRLSWFFRVRRGMIWVLSPVPRLLNEHAGFTRLVFSILAVVPVAYAVGVDTLTSQNLLVIITTVYASVLFFREIFTREIPLPRVIKYGPDFDDASGDSWFEVDEGWRIRYQFNVENRGDADLEHFRILYRVYDGDYNLLREWSESPQTEDKQKRIPAGRLAQNYQVGVPVQTVGRDDIGSVFHVELKIPVRGHPLLTARLFDTFAVSEDDLVESEPEKIP